MGGPELAAYEGPERRFGWSDMFVRPEDGSAHSTAATLTAAVSNCGSTWLVRGNGLGAADPEAP